jgi:hypothetical protein
MLEELVNMLLKEEEETNTNIMKQEIKITRRERRQTKRFHPQDIQNFYQMFNTNLRIMASNKLKKVGYEATENEINVLILIWFNEYMNDGGTFLNVPEILIKKKV